MKKIICSFSICLLSILALAQRNYFQYVNPFIGTGGHGHTYPGASMPFGMIQISPDTRMANWDGSSGYHYSDSVIYGFSHTHLSGTGIPDYCDVLFMPFTGKVNWDNENYRSPFSHASEKASPGFYEVMLDKDSILAQMTTTTRTGMHQYTFPAHANDGAMLIDLVHRDEVLESFIEKVSATEIRGLRRSKSWAQDQYVYFHVEFDQPITEFAILDDEQRVINAGFVQGQKVKAFVRFDTAKEKILKARIGISAVSLEGAKMNLDAEIQDWDFEKIKTYANTNWNKELWKIDVKGGTDDQKTIFYTALYHSMLAPNVFHDINGQFRSTDLKIHRNTGYSNYSVFSLWDTYRALHPLHTIINQDRTKDWINTFLAQYKYGGMLPVWELAGNETFCMIGYHSVPVIFDAYQKGIRGFDTSLALKAMTEYAESNRFGLPYYMSNGYISNEKEHESVSKTLEYAYDDWCIAQFAKSLGKNDIYKKYLQRAQSYKNLYDPSTSHMRGKIQSMWHHPFNPSEVNNFFTEGNSWHYSFAVPQDVTGLINLHGGEENFNKKLEELFTTTAQLEGREQPDVTGLIGQYAHGNEPSHHMAYLFNYLGKPWRTQELVHKISSEFYKNSPDGLIGNEDCGQMSAWYVLSAMGFYPVTPGTGQYIIGTPLFDEVTLHLENGKTFTIKAHRKDSACFYIDYAQLNGTTYTKTYLEHADIMKGGLLEFWLKDTPNSSYGSKKQDRPQSEIKEHITIPVPYFEGTTNKFKDKMEVTINSIDKAAVIYYIIVDSLNQAIPAHLYKKYIKPFFIDKNATIIAFAANGKDQSPPAIQTFHKIPSGRKITILSKVHPMYTAGGPDALIDSLTGTVNWRTGEWQSYFDTDFEAIVEFDEVKPITYLGINVLQDVSPWILYPKEVIFYSSNDGINFIEQFRAVNTIGQELAPAQTQVLGKSVNFKSKYIKIKAVSGGPLPPGHESAGNPSHLFIDEIIIR